MVRSFVRSERSGCTDQAARKTASYIRFVEAAVVVVVVSIPIVGALRCS